MVEILEAKMKTKIAWMIVCLFLRASGCQRQNNEAIFIDDFDINHFLDLTTGETDGSALDRWDITHIRKIHSVAGGVVVDLGVPLSGVLILVRPIATWDTSCNCCGNIWEESGSIIITPDSGTATIEIDGKTFHSGRTKKGKLWIFPTVSEWTSGCGTDNWTIFEVVLPRRNGTSIVHYFTVNFAWTKYSDWTDAAANSSVILGRVRSPQQQQQESFEPYEWLWRTCTELPPTEPMPARLRPYEYNPPEFNPLQWSWQQLQCQTDGWQWQRIATKVFVLPYFDAMAASYCEPFVLFVQGEGPKDNIQTSIAGLPMTLYWLGDDIYCSDYLIPIADKTDQGICYDKWGNKCIAIKYPLEISIGDFVRSWLGVVGKDDYDVTYDLWPDGQIDWYDYAKLERR